MNRSKSISILLCSLFFAVFFGACQKDDAVGENKLNSIQPVSTELRDIDGDGLPEVILAFDRKDILRLEEPNVVLSGRFSDTDTHFETDRFSVQQ